MQPIEPGQCLVRSDLVSPVCDVEPTTALARIAGNNASILCERQNARQHRPGEISFAWRVGVFVAPAFEVVALQAQFIGQRAFFGRAEPAEKFSFYQAWL